jgi:hypothetical protein
LRTCIVGRETLNFALRASLTLTSIQFRTTVMFLYLRRRRRASWEDCVFRSNPVLSPGPRLAAATHTWPQKRAEHRHRRCRGRRAAERRRRCDGGLRRRTMSTTLRRESLNKIYTTHSRGRRPPLLFRATRGQGLGCHHDHMLGAIVARFTLCDKGVTRLENPKTVRIQEFLQKITGQISHTALPNLTGIQWTHCHHRAPSASGAEVSRIVTVHLGSLNK